MMDDLALAIYHTVHDFKPRGAQGLAPLVNIKAGTLNNKADPHHDSELTLRQAVPVINVARDYRIVHSFCHAVDHVAMPRGSFHQCPDTELLTLYCQYHHEMGETAAAISAALAAGRVPRLKVRKVRREMMEDIQAGMELLARLEAIAEDEDA